VQTISPTRMNLLQRRNQLRLAEQGVDLLKKKRDALVQDFFNVVRRALEARELLNRKCEEAYVLLSLTKAWEGREALESTALARKQELLVDIDIRNVWGTKIPEVSSVDGRSATGDGYNPVDVSAGVLETTSNFEEVLAALLEVASTEVKLKKIGEEIKKTTRRVNALEQIVVPRIRSEIRYIRAVLEQREREDIYRLKRIKKKLEAKEKSQTPSHIALPS